jgi:hypothetical protein
LNCERHYMHNRSHIFVLDNHLLLQFHICDKLRPSILRWESELLLILNLPQTLNPSMFHHKVSD